MRKSTLVIAITGGVLFLLGVGVMAEVLSEGFWILAFFGLLILAAGLLIAGLSTRGETRWLNFTMASAMLIGLGVIYIFSLGYFIFPLAVVFLIVSLRKWSRFHSA
ncbi:hypothetical protein ABFB09_05510 [Dehalogenimonas sp. THU2]|uniref:hypothetical protein n=1 Tax=Dehalogenimonas sp. THU2 TaxID=3151121 RepID=UPI0032187792